MVIQGKVKKDHITKNLIHRLEENDIVVIDHLDLDQVSAQNMVERKVKAVINVENTITGRYKNLGPNILLENRIHIYDSYKKDLFSIIHENDTIRIMNNQLQLENGSIYPLHRITKKTVQRKLQQAQGLFQQQYFDFVNNTISYLEREQKNIFFDCVPKKIKNYIRNKEVVIVTRGKDYKRDLKTILSYIAFKNPILIGVDGGADALLEQNLLPDILFGDMDSVSVEGINNSRYIVVHSYANGNAPGLERVRKSRIDTELYNGYGMSEDAAMLMAYHAQAEKIIIVGSHNNIIDFFDKGRKGMASTLLIRMMLGEKLIDVKGIHHVTGGIYRDGADNNYYSSI